jgi:hypothetical protein
VFSLPFQPLLRAAKSRAADHYHGRDGAQVVKIGAPIDETPSAVSPDAIA